MDNILSFLTIFLLLQNGNSALNLRQADYSYKPQQNQYFIETPKNQTVIEGESVTFRCIIGNKAGKVQWTENGFVLGYNIQDMKGVCPNCSPRGDPNKGEFHLHVKNITLGDYALGFECQVAPKDKHKAIRALAYVNVIVPPSGVDLLESGSSKTMMSGTNNNISCSARGANPYARIKWFHGNKQILDQDYTSQTKQGRRNGTWDYIEVLKFQAKPEYDGTKIRCVVEHSALRNRVLEKEIFLTVYHPPSKPKLEGDYKRAYALGQLINITCLSRGGNPPPFVSWYKNSNQLSNKQHKLDSKTTVSHLVIRAEPSLLSDSYSCRAGNSKTPTTLHSRTVKFNVTFSSDRVAISGPGEGQLGETISLECRSGESNPPSNIIWTVEGVKKRGTQKLVTVAKGGWRTTSQLSVMIDQNISLMKVECTVVNDLFKTKHQKSKTIRILRPPEAPIISGLPSNSLREGDSLTLECISKHGSPLPHLKWLRQGEIVRNQTFQKFEGSHSKALLNIIVTRSDNDVVYTCEADNKVSFPALQSTNFLVYFEPLDARLYLSYSGGSGEVDYVKSGDRLQMNCEAGNSNPGTKITWYKNGNEVSGRGLATSQGKFGGVHISQMLLINEGKPVSSNDHGTKFSCVVFNPAINERNITKEYTLNVQYPPEFYPTVAKNYSVVEGEELTIFVKANANPRVETYTWLTQENQPLLENHLPPRFSIHDNTMKVSGVSRKDSGIYIFTAENKVGRQDMEINLNVLYHPRIINLTDQVTADEGSNATFHCMVDANPLNSETVTWGVSGRRDSQYKFTERGAIFAFDGNMTFSMTLPRVSKQDRGNFFCRADNRLKNAQPHRSETNLRVNFKPEIRKFPRYSKFAQRTMHQIGLECVAYGYPDVSIQWFKVGDPGSLQDPRYPLSSRGVTTQVDFGTWKSILVIESVEMKDYTPYQCIATNNLGEDKHNILLTLPSIPDPPTNLKVTKIDYQTVQLRWEPGFDGSFSQTFVTKVKEVKTGKVRHKKTNTSSLGRDVEFLYQEFKLKTDVEYIFSVKSYNVQGDSDYSNEQHESLRVSENRKKKDDKIPRVIIVALVLGSILVVIIALMIITCCVKQQRENTRRESNKNERSSSMSSKKSMIERYPPSKYSSAFASDVFNSSASNCGSTISDIPDPMDYKCLSRSLSVPDPSDSDRGYTSYTGGCSLHGTLKRSQSGVKEVDTSFEDDGHDSITNNYVGNSHEYRNGGPGYPLFTADKLLNSGGRNRAGSLSSPCGPPSAPYLGVSGLYTNHMERRAGIRKYSGGSISPPPDIPSPPPPVTTSTLDRLKKKNLGLIPPPPLPTCNGQFSNIKLCPPELEKLEPKTSLEINNELSRRITELSKDRNVEPQDSLSHLQLNNLPGVFNSSYTDSHPPFLTPNHGQKPTQHHTRELAQHNLF